MRIIIDLQGAQSPLTFDRGIGRYSLGFAETIIRNRNNHEVHLALNAALPDSIPFIKKRFREFLHEDRVHVFPVLDPVPTEPHHPQRIASELCREAFLARLDADVVHHSSLLEGIEANAVASIRRLGVNIPTSVTFYDAIPRIYETEYLSDPARSVAYAHKVEQLRRADLILPISQSSASEAIEVLEIERARVVTVGAAADPNLQLISQGESTSHILLARLGIHRPFVMYTGGVDFRKNIEGLLKGFGALPASIKAKHQLVVVCECSSNDRRRIMGLARRAGIIPGLLVLTGKLIDEDLAQLYSSAKLFVFPSLHEGFGLPVLEAMQFGAPVIGSNCSSIPEVIGLDEALFDPRDYRAIRDSIFRAITDSHWLDRLKENSATQARKFAWDAVGKRAISAFEELVRWRSVESITARKRKKRRLAYVSPLPPAKSGIATYARNLLPHLAEFYEIDVVIDSELSRTETSDLPGVANVIDSTTFRGQVTRYERVIYQFGNSEFHTYMPSLLNAAPGMVVLHEIYLGGLIRHQAIRNGGERQWLKALYENHGAGAVLSCLASATRHESASDYPCSASIIADATGVIMHSAYAVSLAKKWFTSASLRRVVQLPLPHPFPATIDRNGARERLGLEGAKLICSFGYLGTSKNNLDLLFAWMESDAFDDPNCILVFVGEPAQSAYQEAIEREISDRDLGNRVKITGWVDDQSYETYLMACDIAVQLRGDSRGESSLSLLDCMAHGIPVITNAIGATAELPASTVLMLPNPIERGQLRHAIDRLYKDEAAAAALGQSARDFVRTEVAPEKMASRLHEEIESSYERTADLTEALKTCSSDLPICILPRLADLGFNATQVSPIVNVQLDVSELVAPPTSTERRRALDDLVRGILKALPRELRVELVRYDQELDIYLEAHQTLASILNLDRPLAPDAPAAVSSATFLVCLDANQDLVNQRAERLRDMVLLGSRVIFVVDDVRDRASRETFEAWLNVMASSNGVACSSRSIADELLACIGRSNLPVMCVDSWDGDSSSIARMIGSVRTLLVQDLGIEPGSGSRPERRRALGANVFGEVEPF